MYVLTSFFLSIHLVLISSSSPPSPLSLIVAPSPLCLFFCLITATNWNPDGIPVALHRGYAVVLSFSAVLCIAHGRKSTFEGVPQEMFTLLQADPRPTTEGEVSALFPSWPFQCVQFGLWASNALFAFTGGPILELSASTKEAIPETVKLATVLNTGLTSLIPDAAERGVALRKLVVGEVLKGGGRVLLGSVAPGQPKNLFLTEIRRCLVKCWLYPDTVRVYYALTPLEGSGAKRDSCPLTEASEHTSCNCGV